MAVLGKLVAVITADTSKFVKSMNQVEKKLEGTNLAAKNVAFTLAGTLAAAGSAAIATFQKLGSEAVKVGSKFEQTVTTLGALKNATEQTQLALENQARALGEQTLFTATQAAQAMQSLARAGLETNQIIGASGPALFFAGANATSMSSATSLLAATMAQFNLNASEATRITDVFTVAMQNSLLDMESLTTSMRYAGSVANSLGMSLEETTASIALFRDLGLDASTAGTQFRQAMLALAGPTRKARIVMEKYGLSVKTVSGDMKTFEEIMMDIGKAQMTMEDIVALVSKRAAGSVATISENFAKENSKYQSLLEKFGDQAGQTERTYSKMIDTVSGQFGILRSKIEEAMLSAFDSIRNELKEFIKLLNAPDGFGSQLINSFRGASEFIKRVFNQELRETFGDVGESTQTLAAALVNLIVQGIKFTGIISRLVPVLVKMLGVIGATILAFGTYKLTLLAITAASGGLATSLSGLGTALAGIKAAALASGTAVGGLSAAIGSLGTAISITMPQVAAIAAALTAVGGAYYYFRTNALGVIPAQKQITALAKDTSEAYEEQNRQTQRLIKLTERSTREFLVDTQARLMAAGQYSNRINTQISSLQGLSDANKKAQIESGQLTTVMINGENVLMSHSLALSLASTGMADYANIMSDLEKQQDKLNDKEREAADNFNAIAVIQDNLRKSVEGVSGGYSNLNALTNDLTDSGLLLNGTIGDTNVKAGLNKEALFAVERALNQASIAYTQADKKADGFRDSLKQAREEFEKFKRISEATRLLQENEERTRMANQAYEEWRRNVKKLNEQIDKLIEGLSATNEKIKAEEAFQLSQALDAEIKKTSTKFDELFELYSKNSFKQIDVRKKQAKAIGLIVENAYLEEKETLDESTKELVRKQKELGLSKVEQVKFDNENILSEEKLQVRKVLELIDAGREQQVEIQNKLTESKRLNARRNITDSEELAEALLVIEKDNTDAIIKINQSAQKKRENLQEQRVVRGKALEEQLQKELKEIKEKALSEISQLEVETGLKTQGMLFQEQQEAAKKEFELKYKGLEDYEQLYAKFLRGLEAQNEEYAKGLIDTFITPYHQYADEIMNIEQELATTSNKRTEERLRKVLDYYNKVGEAQQKVEEIQKALQDASLDNERRDQLIKQYEILRMNAKALEDQGALSAIEGRFGGNITTSMAAIENDANKIFQLIKEIRGNRAEFAKEITQEGLNIRPQDFMLVEDPDGGVRYELGFEKMLRAAELTATNIKSQFLLAFRGMGKFLDMTVGEMEGSFRTIAEFQLGKKVGGLDEKELEKIGNKIESIIAKREKLQAKLDAAEEKGNVRRQRSIKLEIEALDNAQKVLQIRKKQEQVSVSLFKTTKAAQQEGLFILNTFFAKSTRMAAAASMDIRNFVSDMIITPEEALKDGETLGTTAQYFENFDRMLQSRTGLTVAGYKEAQTGFMGFLKKTGISTLGSIYKVADVFGKLSLSSITMVAKAVVKVFSFLIKQFRAFTQRTVDQFKMVFQRLMSFIGFLTGGFSLSIFSQITESVNEYIQKVDELTDKQKELQEQLRKGEITRAEFREGMDFLEAQKDRSVQVSVVDKFEDAILFVQRLPAIASQVVSVFIKNLPRLFRALRVTANKVVGLFLSKGDDLLALLIDGISSVLVAVLNALADPAFQNKFRSVVEDALIPALNSVFQAVERLLNEGTFLREVARVFTEAASIFLRIKIEVLKSLSQYLKENPVILQDLVSTFAELFVLFIKQGLSLVFATFFQGVKALFTAGIGLDDKETGEKKKGLGATLFGDTPGPIKVGVDGLFAGFAPNDTVIAAQSTSNLLGQALQAYTAEMGATFQTPPMAGGNNQPIDIAIMAEGRLLDAVQVTAMNNGNAPQMNKRFRRASGINVGFNRGRYNKF